MTDSCEALQVSWKVISARLGTFITVGLVVLYAELYGEPTKRGFFCDDETIQYPYKENTISERAVVLGAILLPLVIIFVTQLWTHGLCSGRRRVCNFPVPKWIRTACLIYGSYMLGLGLELVVCSVGKFTVGRLRPHFLDRCRPDIPCNESVTGYITSYNCTGSKDDMIEARLSFPSGHASVGFNTLLYLIMYLQMSTKWRHYGLIRGVIQFLFITLAWWISLTRVMDNWHHWSDVLAGAILGCIAAVLTTANTNTTEDANGKSCMQQNLYNVKYLPGIRPKSLNEEGNSFLPLHKTRVSPQLELSEQS